MFLIQHLHFERLIRIILLRCLVGPIQSVLIAPILLTQAVHVLCTCRAVSWPLSYWVVRLKVIDLSSLGILTHSCGCLSLLVRAITLPFFLSLLLCRGQRHWREADASVICLLGVLLFAAWHRVPSEASAGDVGLGLIAVDGGSTLSSTDFSAAPRNRPSICSHHRSNVHGSVHCVALPPRHHIAIFLLVL